MQIQNLPKAIAQNNPNQPSNLLSGLSHNHDVSGIQLKKMPVMSIDTYEKKPEEESDGSYKKPVEQNNTHAPVEEKLTSGEVSTSVEQDLTTTETPSTEPARLEEFFLEVLTDEEQALRVQAALKEATDKMPGITSEEIREMNMSTLREGYYATGVMESTFEQLGGNVPFDPDGDMTIEEYRENRLKIYSISFGAWAEALTSSIPEGHHSYSEDGSIIYDKDGNDLKVPYISESQYQEGVKKEMDKVLAFLKENEPEYYDIMLQWREDNGWDTGTDQ